MHLGLLAILVLWALLLHVFLSFRVPPGLPPGPFLPLPVLRHLPFSGYFGMTAIEAFDELRRQYGDMFSVHLGHRRVVMMCNFEKVREVFAKQVTKRPEEIVNDWRGGCFGVIFSNGEDWKVQRRLFASTIKSSGFGRGAVERSVEAVWPHIVAEAAAAGDEVGYKAFDGPLMEFLIYTFTSPRIFTGERPRPKVVDTFNIARLFGIQWCEFELWYRFPLLRRLAPGWSGYNLAVQVLRRSHKELLAIVDMHDEKGGAEKTRTVGDQMPDEERKDFIDIYLEKLKEFQKEGQHPLLRDHGTKCIIGTLDNILVGGDGIHLTFYTFVYMLSLHQDVQDKVRGELLSVLGPDRPIELDRDRERLPYCMAFLMEVFRFCSISGYGAPHQVEGTDPVQVGSYIIPPNVDVFPGLRYIMHDKDSWDSPEQFRPERFIDEQTRAAITNHKLFIPFQVGPRACPAKSFVMDATLALLSRVAREFKIEFCRRVKEPRKGLLDGVSFLSEGAAAETDDATAAGDDDDHGLELVGMALVQPKPFTVRMRRISQEKSIAKAPRLRRGLSSLEMLINPNEGVDDVKTRRTKSTM